MISYRDKLLERIDDKKTRLCLGVDFHLQMTQPFFQAYRDKYGIIKFAKKWVHSLLEVAAAYLPAVKFQSSFFEALGSSGYELLGSLVKEASSKGLITILDVKRCDIASTMDAYGFSAFEQIKADAMTIVPYMGLDVIRPLYKWMEKGHGVYSVFLSSNKSGLCKQSYQMNDFRTVADHFHEDILKDLEVRKLADSFGLVVGAESYSCCKGVLGNYLNQYSFLLPGLGFQGAELTKNLTDFSKKRSSHLFPMSRTLCALGDQSLLSELKTVKTFSSYQDFVVKRVVTYRDKLVSI